MVDGGVGPGGHLPDEYNVFLDLWQKGRIEELEELSADPNPIIKAYAMWGMIKQLNFLEEIEEITSKEKEEQIKKRLSDFLKINDVEEMIQYNSGCVGGKLTLKAFFRIYAEEYLE